MIRASAKNHRYVTVVVDPQDYGRVLQEMDRLDGETSEALRFELAVKAFGRTARYDGAIAEWLGGRRP